MTHRERRQLLIFAFAAFPYYVFAEWVCTTPIGTSLFVWGVMVFFLPAMLAFVATPILIVALFFRNARRDALYYLLVSAILVPGTLAGCVVGHKVRTAGMQRFAERSRTLITAIEKYEREHSAPPQTLQELVPDYLPAVPSTGMMAYPEYRYHIGDDATENYAGNAWALSVFTPGGGINFDQMLYFPDRNYPKTGYGGWLEPIGEWAYVHE